MMSGVECWDKVGGFIPVARKPHRNRLRRQMRYRWKGKDGRDARPTLDRAFEDENESEYQLAALRASP
jgi:hypothetical protein